MTTTVSRSTSRRRGLAKIVRAAQQTPLPGDAVTVQVPDAPADNLDSMGLPELRQLARAQGWSTLTKAGKAAIVKALRENPNGPPAQAAAQKPQSDDVESKPSAQVDATRSGEIGERMLALRKEYTRGLLAEAAGTTPSVVWRWEQGRPKPDELVMIEALLAKIAAGEVQKPERPAPFGGKTGGASKAKATLDEIEHVLTSCPVKASVTQLRACVNQALELIEKARA